MIGWLAGQVPSLFGATAFALGVVLGGPLVNGSDGEPVGRAMIGDSVGRAMIGDAGGPPGRDEVAVAVGPVVGVAVALISGILVA